MATLGGISGEYTLDADRSRIGFVARHALISRVRGHFGEFEGSAYLDFDQPGGSSAEVTIQVASIDTGNGPRDDQLRINEFLNATRYPTITFVSSRVEQSSNQRFALTGELTIKGTTREVTLTFDLQSTTPEAGSISFTAATQINRRDWNVEWPPPLETGGVLIGDKVMVEIRVVAARTE